MGRRLPRCLARGARHGPRRRILPFHFDIQDDGAGYYLLVSYSADRLYGADTWHQVLEDAFAAAELEFGIRRDEWTPGPEVNGSP